MTYQQITDLVRERAPQHTLEKITKMTHDGQRVIKEYFNTRRSLDAKAFQNSVALLVAVDWMGEGPLSIAALEAQGLDRATLSVLDSFIEDSLKRTESITPLETEQEIWSHYIDPLKQLVYLVWVNNTEFPEEVKEFILKQMDSKIQKLNFWANTLG